MNQILVLKRFAIPLLNLMLATVSAQARVLTMPVAVDDQFHWEPMDSIPPIPHATDPDGTLKSRPSADCDPRAWEQSLVQNRDGSATAIESFYARCEKQLGAFSPLPLVSIFNQGRIRDHLERKPAIRKVSIKLDSGETMVGLLAIHDLKPRPFVLYICGTGCNSTDSLNQYGMMHLFAESPFNVLAVGNATGDESILLNHRIAVGGLEESHRILELMEILSKPNSPVFNLITSWHIMGVSLGGQTAYYTSVLLSQNKDVKIHAPVQSVIAFCPVINLEPTVRILDSKFLFGNQFRKLMLISGAELLAQMKDASPITQADLDGLTKGNLADTLARVGLPRLDNAINKKHLLKPPFAGTPFKDANDFWHLSDGFNYVSDIQIPTWIIYSKDDQIVAPEENGQKLKMLMATQGNSNLHFIEQSHGTHCANVEAYGWPAISSMWRTIVLSQTRSAGGLKIHRMPLNQTSKGNSGLNLDSGTGKSVDAYEWKMNGPKRVKLTVHMFQPNRRIGQMSCQTFDRSVAFEGCFDQSEFEFNLADLFGAQWIEESKAIGEDVDSLTRWLNTRATLIDDAGASVIRSGTVPTAVQWYSDLP